MHRSPCGVHDIYSFVEFKCFGCWRNSGDWMIKPHLNHLKSRTCRLSLPTDFFLDSKATKLAIRPGHGSVSAGYCQAWDGRYSRRKSALEGRCKDVTIFRVPFFVAMMRSATEETSTTRQMKVEGRAILWSFGRKSRGQEEFQREWINNMQWIALGILPRQKLFSFTYWKQNVSKCNF